MNTGRAICSVQGLNRVGVKMGIAPLLLNYRLQGKLFRDERSVDSTVSSTGGDLLKSR